MKSSTSGIGISGWWYNLDQRAKIGLAVGLGVFVVILCIAAILIARSAFAPSPTEPTVMSPLSVLPTVAPPTRTPSPTDVPSPIDTPVPTATPVPTDAQGDIVTYDDALAPVEDVPAGVDIRTASVGPDMKVTLGIPAEVPEPLVGWAADDDVLLWIELYDPIPDPPTERLEWIFVLDVDGDVETGRPAGDRPINPDLGYEVAVSLYYDPDRAQFFTYYAVWDADTASWVTSADVRYTIDESRTLIGLAVSRAALVAAVESASGVTVVDSAVMGRVAALAGQGAARVADFYPNVP
jgi:hypothetical protein